MGTLTTNIYILRLILTLIVVQRELDQHFSFILVTLLKIYYDSSSNTTKVITLLERPCLLIHSDKEWRFMYKINQGHLTVFCIVFVWLGGPPSPVRIMTQVPWFMYQNQLGPSGGIYYPNFVPCFVVLYLNNKTKSFKFLQPDCCRPFSKSIFQGFALRFILFWTFFCKSKVALNTEIDVKWQI